MPWSFSSFRSYSPESRMREIRQSGLEGGRTRSPYPYFPPKTPYAIRLYGEKL